MNGSQENQIRNVARTVSLTGGEEKPSAEERAEQQRKQACIRAAAWAKANPERVKTRAAAWRKANQEKIKSGYAVWKEKNEERLKAKRAAYYAANSARAKAEAAAWYRKNEKRAKATRKAYMLANREKINAWVRAWREQNPGMRLKTEREYTKKRVLQNPEGMKEAWKRYVHERRARKKAAGGKLSKGITVALLFFQCDKCAICGKDLQETGHHLDHIIPISKGGSNTDGNVQLLCPKCNMRKSDKLPDVFTRESAAATQQAAIRGKEKQIWAFGN